jgi:uncharacterized protein (TIGR01319 family)
MMNPVLLIDFGSTFTKVTAVDLDSEELLGTAKSFTTINTNVMDGLKKALDNLQQETGLRSEVYQRKLACSSAAGGLKMVAVGLVTDLTAEAARRAALGAGAKVLGTYAYELCESDLHHIEKNYPDIILLAGGTDGGDRKTILHNANMLTNLRTDTPFVVAGNKTVSREVADILSARHSYVVVTDNVLPELNRLNVEPARNAIRQVFLDKIVEAKGLTQAEEFTEKVTMPTPAAVLKAAELLAEGWGDEPGLGELVLVDIGGATTDVHSIGTGDPSQPGVNLKGLPEPYGKRTVEGDLGMRYSAVTLGEAAGARLAKILNKPLAQVLESLEGLLNRPDSLPKGPEEISLDLAMGKMCTKLAVERHVGHIETVYTPFGASYIQWGKDLTRAKTLIGTGGVLVHSESPGEILQASLYDQTEPTLLSPKNPEILLDEAYILSGIGLLAEISPEAALRIAKKHLVQV